MEGRSPGPRTFLEERGFRLNVEEGSGLTVGREVRILSCEWGRKDLSKSLRNTDQEAGKPYWRVQGVKGRVAATGGKR